MMFLTEGTKILFRFTYALLKIHKPYIKREIKDPNDFHRTFTSQSKSCSDR